MYWSDNSTKFDGWALFVLQYPTGYTFATVANQNPPQRIAGRFRVNIINGVPDNSVRVDYTTSLEPPNCMYAVWWYDGADVSIYAPTASTELFSVTASPVTLPAVVLNKPAAPTTLPSL